MARARISLLEVDHLGAAAIGEEAGELQVDAEAGDGHDEADEPVDEGQADGARA